MTEVNVDKLAQRGGATSFLRDSFHDFVLITVRNDEFCGLLKQNRFLARCRKLPCTESFLGRFYGFLAGIPSGVVVRKA